MDSTTDAPSAAVNLSTYHSPESRISQSHDDGRSPLQKASFNVSASSFLHRLLHFKKSPNNVQYRKSKTKEGSRVRQVDTNII